MFPTRERSEDEIVGNPQMRKYQSLSSKFSTFTAVLLQLNVRYKTRVAPKLTGIKKDPRA